MDSNFRFRASSSRLEAEILLLQGAHRRWMAQHGRSSVTLSMDYGSIELLPKGWTNGDVPPDPVVCFRVGKVGFGANLSRSPVTVVAAGQRRKRSFAAPVIKCGLTTDTVLDFSKIGD
jgi:hypothetical protein